MRNKYQQKKWKLFQEIEKLKPSEERSALLTKFNNMTGAEQHSNQYKEPDYADQLDVIKEVRCNHGILQACPDCYDSTE